MFSQDFDAHHFIALGECMVVLRNPKVWNAANYIANRDEFMKRLKASPFQATAAASQRLEKFVVHTPTGMANIHPNDAIELEPIAQTVYSVLSHESRRATVILTDQEPPASLMALDCPEPQQQALKLDLIMCLRARLARPSIVMAWALGYDLIRSWIFNDSDRLAAFNKQLGKKPVVKYRDLFRINEAKFLETCCNSREQALQQFTDRTFRDLQAMLDQRNDFAHANFALASLSEAISYVERMVRIATGSPFDK
jgi:hypothetical protein